MAAQLVIEPIGEKVLVRSGQTILDACLRAGVWLPHACCHGLCGTCKIEIISGDIDHGDPSPFALMDIERDEGKALACCATLLADAVIEAEIEEDPDALYVPVRDFEGVVESLSPLTPDIRGIWIDVEGEGIEFQAGQYINLAIPGIEGPRPFSLANPPSQKNRAELHVRRVEGGQGTAYLHDRLAVGDRLSFSGPYGRFFVRKSRSEPIIFIAGGSGLSSLKSMLLDFLENGDDRPIVLFHGVRGQDDLYFADAFRALADAHANFRYVPALSEASPDRPWEGETGFIHEVAERRFQGRFAGHTAYLCGPPVMIEAAIRALMKGRLFEQGIFTERFVTAADGESALARSPVFRKL
jgi:phenol hydroxylase P5 protein